MKVRINKTGEIVEVEYDDDNLYVVLGRHQYLYATEFDIVIPLSDDAVISISKLREVLMDMAMPTNEFRPEPTIARTVNDIINQVKESI